VAGKPSAMLIRQPTRETFEESERVFRRTDFDNGSASPDDPPRRRRDRGM
jgi:hypothetical protein